VEIVRFIERKVAFVLMHHVMKKYREVEVKFHTVCTLALDGGVDHLHVLATLPQGKEFLIPTEKEDGWVQC
jgi:hypothetical protein